MRGKIKAGCKIKNAMRLSMVASTLEMNFILPSRKPKTIIEKTGNIFCIRISSKLIASLENLDRVNLYLSGSNVILMVSKKERNYFLVFHQY